MKLICIKLKINYNFVTIKLCDGVSVRTVYILCAVRI